MTVLAGRRRPRTIRVRATAGAVVVVGVALVAASVVLLAFLRRSEVDEARAAARLRAADIAGSLRAGVDPADLPLEEGEDRFAQVVASGRVVAASPDASDVEPLDDRAGTQVRLPLGDDDDRWLVVVDPVGDEEGHVVVVGRELDPAAESLAPAVLALLIGLPGLLGVVGVTTWRVVGRSLGPVEAIRREVEDLSATGLDRRVPVPAASDEIAELARTMNAMLERLQRSHDRRRRFVSDAAHELRSPIAAIRQHAEVTRDHPDADDGQDLAEVVLAETARLQQLVDDLLLLARADEDSLAARRREIDLDDVAMDEVARVRSVTELSVDATGVGAARIVGDEALVRRAIRNVVDNATRHARSTISIASREADGSAIVEVGDDGPGIAERDRERVIQRFVRLDEARSRDGGGAGLGLAIVAEVALAHRGHVEIGRSPLGGALVTVTFQAAGSIV